MSLVRPGALVAALAIAACHRGGPAPTASGAVTDASGPEATPPETLLFPQRPPGCGYEVPSLSPAHARAAPHAERYGRKLPDPLDLHLTFAGDPAHTVVVQWRTDADTLASEVRYGAGSATDRVARGYSFAYGPGGQYREHEVHLCDLAPSTRYRYDAGGGAHRSQGYAFVTAPDDPREEVRVLVAGDARSDPAAWERVASRAAAEHADVMFFTGDAVVDGASQVDWDRFFAAARDLLATTPALWADGNHEGVSEVYYAQFALPANQVAGHHERFYATTYGPLRVLVLNDTTESTEDQRGVERDWLARELAAVDRARTPWIVAMHHQPLYTTSDGHRDDEVTRAAWQPLFDAYHVDLDLAGHVHDYESSLPLREGAVTDDAHGTRYLDFGGAGAPLYHFRPREPWVLTRESTHGYAVLTASSAGWSWVAHRSDGSVIETITR